MLPSPTVENSVGLDLWAHPLSQPEKGCLLIANPSAFLTRQQYFHQAVIFLFTHGYVLQSFLAQFRDTSLCIDQDYDEYIKYPDVMELYRMSLYTVIKYMS